MSGQRNAARRSLSVAKRCAQLAVLFVMVTTLSGCVLDPRLWACFLGGRGDFTPCIDAVVGNLPDTPTGLTAEAAATGIQLRWDAAENGAEFRVSRGATAAGPHLPIGVAKPVFPDPPSFLDGSAEPSVRHFYTVRRIKGGVLSSPSAVVSAIWRRAPTGLTATPGEGSVVLDWDDSGGADLAGYNVYAGPKSGTLAKVNGAPVPQSQYTVIGLEKDVEYGFLVRAVYPEGESPPSAAMSATPVGTAGPPAAPTGLVGTPGESQVALDWADNREPDFAGYYVYMALYEVGPFNQIGRGLVTTSNFTHSDLRNGVTYYYRVTAVDTGDLESAPSEIVSATPCESCFAQAFANARTFRPAKRPRKSPRRRAQQFRLTLSGSYGGGGKTSERQGIFVVTGLEFTGSFVLRSGKSALRGTWRSRADWRVKPDARRGSASGVALATFADRKVGVACLSFAETQKPAKRGKKIETRGSFMLLGGTAKAARMLGRGSYAATVGTQRTVVYRGKVRSGRGAKRLPRSCMALRR